MNHTLLKLLGGKSENGGTVVAAEWEANPALGWAGWIALAAAALFVIFISYRRRDVTLGGGRLAVLTALKAIALLIILAILLRPGLALSVEGLVRQTLVFAIDQSASFGLRDPRTAPEDRARAAIALGLIPPTSRIDQGAPSMDGQPPRRVDLVAGILTNREMALIERLQRDFDLKAVGFAEGVASLTSADTPAASATTGEGAELGFRWAEALQAEGRESAPGTALRTVLEREGARPLGGIVLVTDGIRNAGPDPREAAAVAREAGVPVHVLALGTTAPRDLQIVEFVAPDVAFVRDEAPVRIRLRGQGLAGHSTRVAVTLDGVPLAEAEAMFDAEESAEISLRFTPEQTGDYVLEASAPARPDEILAENNRQARRLRVVDDRIRVLLLEQSPRWEFRYLQALLLRDRRVELKCVLFDGDPAIARGEDSPYLAEFPTRREDLFAYDLVIFGDVDPRNFTPAQLEFFADFVSRSGGAFLMVAGRRFSPWAYRDTPLERLLPVEFEPSSGASRAEALSERPVKLELTPEGRVSPLLRVGDTEEAQLEQWAALPPLYWIAPVGRAKPAAHVLAREATEGEGGDGGTPVLVIQQYGVGETMFVGTDNTWRWRRNQGEAFWTAFWGRIAQRMAIHHLLSGSRRAQLRLDRMAVMPGERVGLSARLFTSAFEPLSDPAVSAWIETPGAGGEAPARVSELTLRAAPDQPGVYRSEFVAGGPGRYRIRVGEEAPASVDFMVEERWVEAGETAMQEALLREVAAISGGGFFREEDAHRIPEAARSRSGRVRSKQRVEVWSSPAWFLGALFFLGLEWGLRKWWQLK